MIQIMTDILGNTVVMPPEMLLASNETRLKWLIEEQRAKVTSITKNGQIDLQLQLVHSSRERVKISREYDIDEKRKAFYVIE